MSRMLHKVCLSILLALCSCSSPISPGEQNLAVIGGHNAMAPSYFAALHTPGASSPFCGATRIDEQHLLTAAHCVSETEGPLAVWLGVQDLGVRPESLPVDLVRIHPRYHTNRLQHDIAILTVSRMSESTIADGIRIAEESRTPPKLRVYGFGNISRKDYIYPQTLQTAELNLVPQSNCLRLGGAYGQVIEEQMCAGELKYGAHDSCDGDSGGPLVTQESPETLFGIVSWGTGCGRPKRPGVYTRVSAYREWIEQEKKGINALPLTEKIQALFYYPLYQSVSFPNGDVRIRRFTAAYQNWKPTESDKEFQVVSQWQRLWDGEAYRLELLQSKGSRYRLRLTVGQRTFEVPAFYTELTPQPPEESTVL